MTASSTPPAARAWLSLRTDASEPEFAAMISAAGVRLTAGDSAVTVPADQVDGFEVRDWNNPDSRRYPLTLLSVRLRDGRFAQLPGMRRHGFGSETVLVKTTDDPNGATPRDDEANGFVWTAATDAALVDLVTERFRALTASTLTGQPADAPVDLGGLGEPARGGDRRIATQVRTLFGFSGQGSTASGTTSREASRTTPGTDQPIWDDFPSPALYRSQTSRRLDAMLRRTRGIVFADDGLLLVGTFRIRSFAYSEISRFAMMDLGRDGTHAFQLRLANHRLVSLPGMMHGNALIRPRMLRNRLEWSQSAITDPVASPGRGASASLDAGWLPWGNHHDDEFALTRLNAQLTFSRARAAARADGADVD